MMVAMKRLIRSRRYTVKRILMHPAPEEVLKGSLIRAIIINKINSLHAFSTHPQLLPLRATSRHLPVTYLATFPLQNAA
jgi:hypothetical protein